MHNLFEHWRSYNLDGPLYIHPKDRAHFEQYRLEELDRPQLSYRQLIGSSNYERDMRGLQFSVYPGPFLGDLTNADIFILLLNPGFAPSSLYAQEMSEAFRDANKKTLQQDLSDFDFPFFVLDPQFCWTGGYHWWESKLRSVALTYANISGISYFQAMQTLSKRIAAIELYPYASSSFKHSKAMKNLPSRNVAESFVRNTLVPRCQNGECEIIVTRKVREWGFEFEENVGPNRPTLYSPGQSRGASLRAIAPPCDSGDRKRNSPGGDRILRRLLS